MRRAVSLFLSILVVGLLLAGALFVVRQALRKGGGGRSEDRLVLSGGAASWRVLEPGVSWKTEGDGIRNVPLPSAPAGGLPTATVRVRLPGAAAVFKELAAPLSADSVLAFAVRPAEHIEGVRVVVFLKDKDGLWFQKPVEGELEAGRWQVMDVPLPLAAFEAAGHAGRWGGSARLNTVGLAFSADRPVEGDIRVAEIVRRATAPAGALALYRYLAGPDPVERFGRYEIAFEMNRLFSNPFDPAEVAVDATFIAPSGRVMNVPGFYFQDYRRVRRGAQEILRPEGSGGWRVRFSPVETGRHLYTLSVKTRREALVTKPRFLDVRSSARKGFVRVSARDPRYFERDDGNFFFPIGQNIRSPNDPRCCGALQHEALPDRGTFAYDDYVPKMAAAGENLFEMWMASWWTALEWKPGWKGYFGSGQYNLESAWKLDYVLDLADRHGMAMHLVLDNHGKISEKSDQEWKDNDLNAANGGILKAPNDFFSDGRAKDLYRRKLRYIAARWGYSTAVMGIEFWSELDLTTGYKRGDPDRLAWHREMSRYLRDIDPWNHLQSTHFCGTYHNIDPGLVGLPEMDYIVGDAYRDKGGIVQWLSENADFTSRFRKPGFVTEFGGTPHGSGRNRLVADLHAGIWSSFMTGNAGTPLFWWFHVIDRENLYPHFAAFSRFVAGEDLRDPSLMVGRGEVRLPEGAPPTQARALVAPVRAYAWIFDAAAMEEWPPEPGREIAGARVILPGLDPGNFTVEFWDTGRGEKIRDEVLAAEDTGDGDAELAVPLPTFKNDIALKIKKK
ncbi:MAG: DUF5060 domain-containing protein [Planctomycetota bacterium]